MKLKQATEPKLPLWVCSTLSLILSAAVSAAAGMGFITISGAAVAMPIMVFSTAVLVLLPAFIMKTYSIFSGLRNRRLLTPIILAGCLLSVYPTLCYYVSFDYELSVYRYMRVTDADIYYFCGYEELAEEYFDSADLMQQMQAAPAAVLLDGMSDEKLSKLTASQLKAINSQTLWDYLGFGEILGDDPDEVEASVRASRSMNAYDFTFGYRGLRAKTLDYMLTHPDSTSAELRAIASAGSRSVQFSVLAAFLISQIFVLYVIGLHFDINAKGQLIYIIEPSKPGERVGALRFTADVLGEMRSHWRMK